FPVSGCRAQSRELARVVAPRLVAREDQTVLTDPALLDLFGEPAGGAADGPAGVGVHLLAGLDPVEETMPDEFDVRADAATHGNEMDLHVIAVAIDEGTDMVDVACTARGRVNMH